MEKSPKAKQYYTTTLVLSALLSKGSALNYTHFIQPNAFTHLHSFIPYTFQR